MASRTAGRAPNISLCSYCGRPSLKYMPISHVVFYELVKLNYLLASFFTAWGFIGDVHFGVCAADFHYVLARAFRFEISGDFLYLLLRAGKFEPSFRSICNDADFYTDIRSAHRGVFQFHSHFQVRSEALRYVCFIANLPNCDI